MATTSTIGERFRAMFFVETPDLRASDDRTDRFVSQYSDNSFKFSATNSIVTKTKEGAASACLGAVESGIHRWTFKITHKSTSSCIGVWNASQFDPSLNLYLAGKRKFYGFLCHRKITTYGDSPYRREYGAKCKSGDIVSMTLDLHKLELSFSINNKDYGVAHNVPKTIYRAAVYASNIGNSFQLLSYQEMTQMSSNDDIKCKKCDSLLEEVGNLKQRNRKLREENNEITSEIALKNGVINSLNETSDEMRQNLRSELGIKNETINSLNEQLRLVNHANTQLTQKYNQANGANIKLNEECKELQMNLEQMTEKYNKLYQKSNINERNYLEWDSDTITDWIISLSEEYERYENTLRVNMKDEQVDGSLLSELDKNDLHRFGIIVLKHKIGICKQIQRLTTSQQKQKLSQNDEGAGTAYI